MIWYVWCSVCKKELVIAQQEDIDIAPQKQRYNRLDWVYVLYNLI